MKYIPKKDITNYNFYCPRECVIKAILFSYLYNKLYYHKLHENVHNKNVSHSFYSKEVFRAVNIINFKEIEINYKRIIF